MTMHRRSGVSKTSKASVATPGESGSQARKAKTLRPALSLIMVRRWLPEPLRVSLKLAAQLDPSEIGQDLKHAHQTVRVWMYIVRSLCSPNVYLPFPFESR